MRPAVAALACAVALGGCGEEESGESLSKAEYEDRFREIVRETEAAAPDSPSPTTAQEQAEQIDTGLDGLRESADQLAESAAAKGSGAPGWSSPRRATTSAR